MISPLGRILIVLIVVFTLLSFLSLVLRFYTLIKIRRRPLRPDDYIITLSTVSMLAVVGAVISGIAFHYGTSLYLTLTLTKHLM
ncbi:hypothetical protein F4677DRAFT_438740 [Hypoxylon crocopeplum]|nr:hypothetical protein F4677DRAFT_438740 [Hypoxylon crocopeplum]